MIVLVKCCLLVSLLLLFPALLNYLFLEGIEHKVLAIPRACISTKQTNYQLCYTCFNRNLSSHFKQGVLNVSSI
jgi:hypothetical protein